MNLCVGAKCRLRNLYVDCKSLFQIYESAFLQVRFGSFAPCRLDHIPEPLLDHPEIAIRIFGYRRLILPGMLRGELLSRSRINRISCAWISTFAATPRSHQMVDAASYEIGQCVAFPCRTRR